ncbi:hypothetical protein PHLCEN_2v3596 [Hermanssonia centrifuga]|uniref:Uncharacterized protein n=1 Tax=Hermanssonia centrifuga TaxID=98765 RepID=A0A2R6QER1_9APHY|nr:hypothetical protein PHLCEN_2v3596 [Hermanssonia centrifuga]
MVVSDPAELRPMQPSDHTVLASAAEARKCCSFMNFMRDIGILCYTILAAEEVATLPSRPTGPTSGVTTQSTSMSQISSDSGAVIAAFQAEYVISRHFIAGRVN